MAKYLLVGLLRQVLALLLTEFGLCGEMELQSVH
jgi:hypothetical protein